MVTPDTRMPSTFASCPLTDHNFNKPYCVLRGVHHSGVSRPRAPAKSEGLVHVPISVPLIQMVRSDGPSRLYSGASEQTSMLNSRAGGTAPDGYRCGKRYSTQ